MISTPWLQKHVRHLLGPARRWPRLFAIAAAVGICAGLAAVVLEGGLHWGSRLLLGRFVDPSGADVLHFRPVLLLLPAVGGLVSALLVRWLCPQVAGQGTNTVIHAFHQEGGVFPLRAPLVRAAGAVGVISCGGSAGPEGPIAAVGAALGSALSAALGLTPRERRVMLVAGCGAGVGAIFQCPLGGALFAAGILYRDPELETEAVVPALVASVIGYSTYILFWEQGLHTLPGAGHLGFHTPWELLPYAVLGLVCGLFGICLGWCMRRMESRPLARMGIPSWLAPALGGLATGAVACALPQVMDGQYRFIKNAMSGSLFAAEPAALEAGPSALTVEPSPTGPSPSRTSSDWWRWAALFGAVAIAKCVATALTVGSGASGGVLGPSTFIGGAAGALVGAVLLAVAPGWLPAETMDGLRQAMIPVGMAGVLSATMRAPLASIVIVAEMTGGYGLIVPSMLVCVGSYVVGRGWGLNSAQVRTSTDSPAHAGDALVHILEAHRVGDLLPACWPETVPPSATLREMIARIRPGTRPVFAVVENEHLVGLISLADIQRIMDEPGLAEVIIAADMMSERPDGVFEDEDAYRALTLMARDNLVVLPVNSRGQRRFLGMVSRGDIHLAVRRRLDEMREHLLQEHEGLAAIEQEERLQHLVMGVAPPRAAHIQRLLVPIQAVGRSLRQANFRREFGVQVIAIEQPDGSLQCPPDPDAPLETRQRLVVIAGGEGG